MGVEVGVEVAAGEGVAVDLRMTVGVGVNTGAGETEADVPHPPVSTAPVNSIIMIGIIPFMIAFPKQTSYYYYTSHTKWSVS